MAKEKAKPKWPFGKPIGHIRISGRDLVDLLKKYEKPNIKIVAETSGHTFEGTNDMEENLPLLQGDTKIELQPEGRWVDALTVKLGYCASIEASSFSESKDSERLMLRQNLEAELRSLRTPIFSFFSMIPRFVWWGLIIGFSIGEILPGNDSETSMSGPEAVMALLVWVCFMISVLAAFVKPVYFLQRDTFWHRNKDKIIIAIAMLFLGILLNEFFPIVKGFFQQ